MSGTKNVWLILFGGDASAWSRGVALVRWEGVLSLGLKDSITEQGAGKCFPHCLCLLPYIPHLTAANSGPESCPRWAEPSWALLRIPDSVHLPREDW